MASENARAVAKEVLQTIGKGGKVSVSKIARKHGYSKHTAKTPKRITSTKTYQQTVQPVVVAMQALRDRTIAAIASKNLKSEKLAALSLLAKNLTHDIQLLTGGKTEDLGLDQLTDDIKELITSVKKK